MVLSHPMPFRPIPSRPSPLISPHPSPSWLWVQTQLYPTANCSKAITLPQTESSCLPLSSSADFQSKLRWRGTVLAVKFDGDSTGAAKSQPGCTRQDPGRAWHPSIPLQPLPGEPSRWVARGKLTNELSLTCGLELHWVVNFSISFMDLE